MAAALSVILPAGKTKIPLMRRLLYVSCWLSAMVSLPAYTHPGPLDSQGCHPNVAHGSYHCHAGPLAGQQYKSKDEMLQDLLEHERNERRKAKDGASGSPTYFQGGFKRF